MRFLVMTRSSSSGKTTNVTLTRVGLSCSNGSDEGGEFGKLLLMSLATILGDVPRVLGLHGGEIGLAEFDRMVA